MLQDNFIYLPTTLMGKDNKRAPEYDDQAYRKRGLPRRILHHLGLKNIMDVSKLLHNTCPSSIVDADRTKANMDYIIEGDQLEPRRFVDKATRKAYNVHETIIKLDAADNQVRYAIVQQADGDRLYGIVKLERDDSTDEWKDVKGVGGASEFFSEYTIDDKNGGISYKTTHSSLPKIVKDLRDPTK